MTSRKEEILESLRDAEYRKLFRADELRTRLALKIREMREARGLTQKTLGELVNKPQAVISRLENPDYGRFTLATLEELADAFDVHLYVDFVRFSKLAEWMDGDYPDDMIVPGFKEDYDSYQLMTLSDAIEQTLVAQDFSLVQISSPLLAPECDDATDRSFTRDALTDVNDRSSVTVQAERYETNAILVPLAVPA
jgi:transcriptional regulator with XRE-family HTH domain